MRNDFRDLDFDVLERLYHHKSKELEKDLLSGVAWEEVRIKRKQLSRLSEALHQKLQERTGGRSDPSQENYR